MLECRGRGQAPWHAGWGRQLARARFGRSRSVDMKRRKQARFTTAPIPAAECTCQLVDHLSPITLTLRDSRILLRARSTEEVKEKHVLVNIVVVRCVLLCNKSKTTNSPKGVTSVWSENAESDKHGRVDVDVGEFELNFKE